MAHSISVVQTETFPLAEFEVTVADGIESMHRVHLREEYFDQLTAGDATTPEDLVHRSFEFLLAREPNTDILEEFDLADISSYFPEFEQDIRS